MSAEPWIAPDKPDLVWFSGDDAVRFLNDLISQEIAHMAPGDVKRSLLLQPQGKLDQILWVLKGDDRVGLVTEEGRGDELAAGLGRYRIRVDVEIEMPEEPRFVVVGSHEFDEGTWRSFNDGIAADISWAEARRTLVTANKPTVAEGSLGTYEQLRILSGEPRWGVDVDEKTIPQEAGLVDSGVDFDKGCYLGQELVARIDSRGRVNRHLRILQSEGPLEAGSPVSFEGDEVGMVTSAVSDVGLAMLRREVGVGDVVDVAGMRARVREIPKKPQT